MLATATKYNSNCPPIYNEGKGYIDTLMELYQKYIYQYELNKILAKNIELANSKIQEYTDSKETSYDLFCNESYDEAINGFISLKEKSEFLLASLSIVYKVTKDKRLKQLIEISNNVIQDFIIKLMDYTDIYTDLKNYEGIIDEESDEYINKMNEIVAYITTKPTSKSVISFKNPTR